MQKKKIYLINEIFLSVQGEGARLGMAAVFVRFAGCNLKCTKDREGFNCDTDLKVRFKRTLHELVADISKTALACREIIFTGGEPALQLDPLLCRILAEKGYSLGVETNGTIDLKPLEKLFRWVTISPKGKTDYRKCDELKLVLKWGQFIDYEFISQFRDRKGSNPKIYLSPAFEGKTMPSENVQWCFGYVLDNPRLFSLTLQAHKILGVR
jgi:7-carboxy-7-deazaguanine synthase